MIFFYDFPLYYDQVSHQFWYQTEVDIIVIPDHNKGESHKKISSNYPDKAQFII